MNKEKLNTAKNLFLIALGLDITVTTLVVISDFWGASVLKDIGAGRIAADQSTISILEFWNLFAKLMLITMLGVGLGLVRWLKACFIFAKESIGASGFKQEGWTTSGWIIPIFNLFKPYQVINEIYKAGSTSYDLPNGWKKVSGSGLLLGWWIFWAVTHLIGWVVGKQMFKSAMRDDMTLQQSISAIELHAWFCIVFLVISVLWIVVANELTNRLLERESGEDSSSLRVQTIALASHQQATPQSPKQMTPPQKVDIPKRSNESNCLDILTGSESGPLKQHTTTKVLESAMSSQLLTEEDHWATAMAEVENDQRRPGVWAKAFAESDGDETKAKVAYLKARVQQIADSLTAELTKLETYKKEQIAMEHLAVQKRHSAISGAIAQFKSSGTISVDQIKLLIKQCDLSHLITLKDSIEGNTLLHICAQSDMAEEVLI